MLRIAHLSDIHFGMENVAALEAARVWLLSETPDLCVITGDLTSSGAHAEFKQAAKWVGGLTGPTLVIPGNHDTPYLGMWERLTAPFARFERNLGPSDNVLWSDGQAGVVGVNTARGAQLRLNWSKGAIGPGQTRGALKRLATCKRPGLRVAACHHPLVDLSGGPMTARVRGGHAAARRFCAGGVDLILSGHIHMPSAGALPYGDGHTYAVGASTLSTRERGAPAGFNLISIHETAFQVTALGWVDDRLQTAREWSLPRRPAGDLSDHAPGPQ